MKPSISVHKAPAHLSNEARAWWEQVVTTNPAMPPHRLQLLTIAAEALDQYSQAREAIRAAGGPIYIDRFQAPRLRPETNIMRDARLAFVRILGELGLQFSPTPPAW